MHISVLKNEVLVYLQPKAGDWIIDATLGFGGHARAILEKIGPAGFLIGIDQDEEVLNHARQDLKEFKNVLFYHRNFEDLENIVRDVRKKKGEGRFKGILFDLGMSSYHVEVGNRGFSFLREGPLDMRFDRRNPLTAYQIVNHYSYEKLLYLFTTYGEEPRRRSEIITKALIHARRRKPIQTTTELAELVFSLSPHERRGKHPATRIFQALRIAVNRELQVLEKGLRAAFKVISPGGRIVIISFHSLEDRIIKNLFREYSLRENPPRISILTKKPVVPSPEEIRKNPRARSAKLRACKRIL